VLFPARGAAGGGSPPGSHSRSTGFSRATTMWFGSTSCIRKGAGSSPPSPAWRTAVRSSLASIRSGARRIG